MRVYDVGAKIEITEPADAIPFTPVPTPTPTLSLPQVTATAQAAQNGLGAVAKWPVVLSDAFDSNEHGWKPDASKSIRDGKYIWTVADGRAYSFELPELKEVAEAAVSVDARFPWERTCGYGLAFTDNRAGDMTSMVFSNLSEEMWLIAGIEQPSPNVIHIRLDKHGISDAIVTGGTNHLMVVKRGAQYEFFINDRFIAAVTDDRLEQARIGLSVSHASSTVKCRVEFDSFEVRAPCVRQVPTMEKVSGLQT